MTDMREKMAPALEPELWERWDKEVDMYLPEYKQARLDKPWTKITESLVRAKAAIEAYREPTDEMLLVGARSIGKMMGMANHIERARACWNDMTNAALEGNDADKS